MHLLTPRRLMTVMPIISLGLICFKIVSKEQGCRRESNENDGRMCYSDDCRVMYLSKARHPGHELGESSELMIVFQSVALGPVTEDAVA